MLNGIILVYSIYILDGYVIKLKIIKRNFIIWKYLKISEINELYLFMYNEKKINMYVYLYFSIFFKMRKIILIIIN